MPLPEESKTMKDVQEVLDEKECELLKCRMDIMALMRAAPLLTDPSDFLDALGALNMLRQRVEAPGAKRELP